MAAIMSPTAAATRKTSPILPRWAWTVSFSVIELISNSVVTVSTPVHSSRRSLTGLACQVLAVEQLAQLRQLPHQYARRNEHWDYHKLHQRREEGRIAQRRVEVEHQHCGAHEIGDPLDIPQPLVHTLRGLHHSLPSCRVAGASASDAIIRRKKVRNWCCSASVNPCVATAFVKERLAAQF